LGPGPSDLKSIRILNRIVEWKEEGIVYEADQRHAEICLKEMGLDESSREVSTPCDKSLDDIKNSNALKANEEGDEKLEPSQATHYRAMTARMNYLGQDRSEIQFAIKELSKEMSCPSKNSWGRLKRLLRYLKGRPRYRIWFEYQKMPSKITVWSDSDFAGCKKSRKSTSAGVLMMGAHTLKTWATNQAVLALSSGEAEYYAIVKAASVAIGIRSLAADMGITFECPITIKSDASAAIGIGSRVGIGKVRHIEVTQLWVQEKVVNGEIVIEKVATEDNLADALTKAVDAQIIQKHVLGTSPRAARQRTQ
jgi:hypothetical protein